MSQIVENKDSKDGLISLKVKSQDSQEQVVFKIKRNTPLQKLMEKYCERLGIANISLATFLFEGERIFARNTPEQLSMRDNDVIEVQVNQVGG